VKNKRRKSNDHSAIAEYYIVKSAASPEMSFCNPIFFVLHFLFWFFLKSLSLLNNLLSQGEFDQVREVVDIELLHEIAAVGFHGFVCR